MLVFAIHILKFALLAWLGFLAVFVIRDVFLTQRPLRGILSNKDGLTPDPERVVLLLFTIGFAFYYCLTTLGLPIADLPKINDQPAMPDVSDKVLVVLFGAQSTYLLGKVFRLYKGVLQ